MLPSQLTNLIKKTSILLISGAIGLELWNIYTSFAHRELPSFLIPMFWIGRFAIAAHGLEALIAAFWATSKQKRPLQYAIYTFFVGTVGLMELFE
ncbi:Alr4224 protein [Tumidithrix helvetica PCC 7403]